jgi:hypothetical protein
LDLLTLVCRLWFYARRLPYIADLNYRAFTKTGYTVSISTAAPITLTTLLRSNSSRVSTFHALTSEAERSINLCSREARWNIADTLSRLTLPSCPALLNGSVNSPWKLYCLNSEGNQGPIQFILRNLAILISLSDTWLCRNTGSCLSRLKAPISESPFHA